MSNVNQSTISEHLQEKLSMELAGSDVPVYVRVYRRLHKLITDGDFKNGEMLPTEMELSRLMGVGRTSLRSALMLLCEDGYAKTYRGRGTFVSWNGERKAKFSSGYELASHRIERELGECVILASDHRRNSFDAFISEELGCGDDSVNLFAAKYGANGKEVAISNIYYPAKFCSDETVSIKSFLEKLFYEKAAEAHCLFAPVNSAVLKSAGIKGPADKFILVSSLWIDQNGEPIAYCKDYYNIDEISFAVSFSCMSSD